MSGLPSFFHVLRLYSLCGAVLLATMWPSVVAANQVLSSGFWADSSGVATIEQAEAAQYTPFEGVLSRGFSTHPYWIRLDLPAGQAGGEDWVVRIQPAWHDEIRLYDSASPGEEWVTGDRYPRSDEGYQSLNLNFRIQQIDHERSLYLRVDTVHGLLFRATVHPLSEAITQDQRQFAFMMSYLAFLGFVWFISVIAWFGDREPVLGWFCLQLTLAMLYGASMYGVFRVIFDGVIGNHVLDAINNLLILAYPAAVVGFYRMFLLDYGVYGWVRQLLLGVLIFAAINAVLIVSGVAVELSLALNNVSLLLATLLIFISPWVLIDRSQRLKTDNLPLWAAGIATSVMASWAFVSLASALGVPVSPNVSLNSFLVHPFVLAVLMSILLQYRARERLKRITAEHSAASQHAIEERATRETLQQFMGMLSHEIKTPLSVVSLAADQGIKDKTLLDAAERAIKDINDLVMRCLQADQVEAGAFEPKLQQFALNDITIACIEGRPEAASRLNVRTAVLAKVWGDPWFSQVILNNLLENAIKYGHADCEVDIALEPKVYEGRAGWTVRVSNAIDARERIDPDRVFGKFYRGERAARRSGAGLGLYLAQALAHQQGGTLTFNQPELARVEFELWLPS